MKTPPRVKVVVGDLFLAVFDFEKKICHASLMEFSGVRLQAGAHDWQPVPVEKNHVDFDFPDGMPAVIDHDASQRGFALGIDTDAARFDNNLPRQLLKIFNLGEGFYVHVRASV